ncbi:hypothetical protein BHM03_00046343, partial [Ensete ventricosum]
MIARLCERKREEGKEGGDTREVERNQREERRRARPAAGAQGTTTEIYLSRRRQGTGCSSHKDGV